MAHSQNSNFTYRNTAIIGLAHIEAPRVVPSTEFEERLAPMRQTLRLPDNLLERVSGVRERRWWHEDTDFEDMAADAGTQALAAAGVDASEVGVLINASVSRSHLEPAVAVRVHDRMGLPSSTINFDVTNACLGFVNGIQLAAAMIDSGQINYAVVVDAEDVRPTQEQTLARLAQEGSTRHDYLDQFASLTLGDGAAAAVIGRASDHVNGHRVVGATARAGTEFHDLCVGSFGKMTTDTDALLRNGLRLVVDAWHEGEAYGREWSSMDRYITHQVSAAYAKAIQQAVGLDPATMPITYDKWGNVGPASIAMTLSEQSATLNRGDRVMCLGVGSGLNTAMLELEW